MKKVCLVLTVPLLGVASAAAQQTSSTAPSVVVLKAARLFDGRSESAVENGMVVIEGSKIREVGKGLAIPDGATSLDLGDATLLPGS